MKILITGRPGIGKTTVVKKLAACSSPIAGGFLTEEIRRQGRRVAFGVRDLHSGKQGVLAHVDRTDGPRVGKYVVDVASFDRVATAALRGAARRPGCVVIDEIGRMELNSKAFREMLEAILDSGRPLVATIPVHRHPLLDRLRNRSDVTLIEVTASNRDELPQRLAKLLGLSHSGAPAR